MGGAAKILQRVHRKMGRVKALHNRSGFLLGGGGVKCVWEGQRRFCKECMSRCNTSISYERKKSFHKNNFFLGGGGGGGSWNVWGEAGTFGGKLERSGGGGGELPPPHTHWIARCITAVQPHLSEHLSPAQTGLFFR